MTMTAPVNGRFLTIALLASGLCACNAGLKTSGEKLATKITEAPPGAALDPPPPPGVYWVRVKSGTVPKETPGNQKWDEVGELPDPYVVLTLNGKEIMRTDPAGDTYSPTWDGEGANFAIGSGAELEILVRDSDAVGDDLLMGRAKFEPPSAAQLSAGIVELDTGRRGKVRIEFQKAHAVMGLGFDYWVQNGRLVIKEVWKNSPAGRAGVEPGDELLAIAGREIKQMRDRAVRSAINSISTGGAKMVIKKQSGSTDNIILKVGPIYPLFTEYGPID